MPSNLVNLDALIPRADFAYDAGPQNNKEFLPLQTHDLKEGSPMLLRKPDFQRETSQWSPDKVRDLVVSFASEDLVPSVILWRSPMNEAFVIDGAHRLSSLIAWVNDDYGDGVISKRFFGDVPTAQADAAAKTRKMVEEAVGRFDDIELAYKNERFARYQPIATRLRYCSLYVQTLQGDTEKAEASFFRINRQGVRLDGTELTLLHSRNCPNAVAARAINQNGTGHPHWKNFSDHREEIESLAKEINNVFFVPPLTSSVVKTTDVPVGGKQTAAGVLSMLLSAVNIANDIPGTVPSTKAQAEKLVPPDLDGSSTVETLKRLRRVVQRIHSSDVCSLGLDPFVYFYSPGGRHLPSSLLAAIEWIADMEKRDVYKQFLRVRAAFEEFLVANHAFIPQIVRKARGEIRAVNGIKSYFDFCIREFQERDASASRVKAALLNSESFNYLKPSAYDSTEYGEDFSSEVKSELTISHHLATALRCDVCHARIDYRAISFDHALDKTKGGDGNPENRAPTHRFCNSAKTAVFAYFKKHGRPLPYNE